MSNVTMFKLLYFFLIVLLTSCTVGPDYRQPSWKLPSYYSDANKKESHQDNREVNWYYSFNDSTLIDLIQQAVSGNNLDIQKALANVRQARAELRIVKADFWPQLNAALHVTRDRLSANQEILSSFPAGAIPLSYTNYRAEFDASWEIDIFGHTRRNVEASLAHFQSTIENKRNVEIIVAAEVARIYTQYRVYQERIIIAKRTINYWLETVKLTNLQLKSGYATQLDLDQAESALMSAKAILPPLQAEARATLAALAVLVGQYPETLFTHLNNTSPVPLVHQKKLSVGLPSDLLRKRPDIRMAERELAAATADIGVAVANLYPRFQLVGDLGTETTKPGTYFQKASAFWTIGPQFSLPIFQGGRLVSAVKAQEALRDAACASYRQAVLQALADVESSLVRYHRERMRQQELLASYNKLKSTRNLTRLQYRLGQINLLDVLNVERQLDDAHDQYVQSTGQLTIYLIALNKSLGGNFYNNS